MPQGDSLLIKLTSSVSFQLTPSPTAWEGFFAKKPGSFRFRANPRNAGYTLFFNLPGRWVTY